MPYVVLERVFEFPVSAHEVRKFPAGWTGLVEEEVADAIEAAGAGRIDADREPSLSDRRLGAPKRGRASKASKAVTPAELGGEQAGDGNEAHTPTDGSDTEATGV